MLKNHNQKAFELRLHNSPMFRLKHYAYKLVRWTDHGNVAIALSASHLTVSSLPGTIGFDHIPLILVFWLPSQVLQSPVAVRKQGISLGMKRAPHWTDRFRLLTPCWQISCSILFTSKEKQGKNWFSPAQVSAVVAHIWTFFGFWPLPC